MNKAIILLVILMSIIGNAQDLKTIRAQYPEAVKDSEKASELRMQLEKIGNSGKPVVLAYKGAVLTVEAKFAKKNSDKKDFFKEGVALIEDAVKADSSNIEIRYLRLGVQENSPKFLGYHKNIEEDKAFILRHYDSISSSTLKGIIKKFVMESGNFEADEKSKFN